MAAKQTRSGSRGWTESEWKQMLPAPELSGAGARQWPKVLSARYDAPSQLVVLQLSSGARFGIPADRLEGVASSDDLRRAVVTVSASGQTIEFPQIGEQFHIGELLTGIFGSRAWTAQQAAAVAKAAAPSKPAKPAAPVKASRSKPAAKPAKGKRPQKRK